MGGQDRHASSMQFQKSKSTAMWFGTTPTGLTIFLPCRLPRRRLDSWTSPAPHLMWISLLGLQFGGMNQHNPFALEVNLTGLIELQAGIENHLTRTSSFLILTTLPSCTRSTPVNQV